MFVFISCSDVLVDDIFMALFFGIAAKEITESCLPGGALSSPAKAANPLLGKMSKHLVMHGGTAVLAVDADVEIPETLRVYAFSGTPPSKHAPAGVAWEGRRPSALEVLQASISRWKAATSSTHS